MAIPQDWMPSGMSEDDKDGWADQFPDDPHLAAAHAWEDWAAQMDPDPTDGATHVSTGAQYVSYAKGVGGPFGRAMSRAVWHRSRAKVKSVKVGPQHEWADLKTRDVDTTDSEVEFYGDDFLGMSRAR